MFGKWGNQFVRNNVQFFFWHEICGRTKSHFNHVADVTDPERKEGLTDWLTWKICLPVCSSKTVAIMWFKIGGWHAEGTNDIWSFICKIWASLFFSNIFEYQIHHFPSRLTPEQRLMFKCYRLSTPTKALSALRTLLCQHHSLTCSFFQVLHVSQSYFLATKGWSTTQQQSTTTTIS